MAKKLINRFWIDVAQTALVVILAIVAVNWSYFAKQVSAWWLYDVLNTTSTDMTVIDQPNRLVISSLGLNVPLVEVEATDEVTVQHGLEQGVVHYPNTAAPGEFGNAYYFGHSSDYAFKDGNYKTVFATLPRIEVGAEILITNSAGRQFSYVVRDKKVVEAKDMSVLSQGDRTQKLLTMQTSWPLGTALKRYVVVAELVK
ncbi:MAG: sortase [Patescibacteria group bacterium]|jgi:LPXTG-site transpeptidase (sortase) family protein